VFGVSEPAYDRKEEFSDLWIVPADGSAKPRRLTFTKSPESGTAWSPDSRRLAFSAKREGDEVSQIYVLDVADGGEAIRVSSISTGASSPRWSPNGKALLFTSVVYPGAVGEEANKKIASERKARQYNARVYDGFPIRRWDKWLDDTQPHLFVQSLEPGATAKDLLGGSRLVAEPGFAGTWTRSGEELVAAWAPDGQSIVFAALTNRDAAAYSLLDTHVFEVSVTGGEPKQLTSGRGNYSRPTFRPDGKALYCLYTPRTNHVYNLGRVAMFAWPQTGKPTIVTGSCFPSRPPAAKSGWQSRRRWAPTPTCRYRKRRRRPPWWPTGRDL
jgi:Tol biopolymer transport system component